MNPDLELARAVFPDREWVDFDTRPISVKEVKGGLRVPGEIFYPLGTHFADVLAWLLRTNWPALKAALVKSDGTAASIKQAVYEAAILVIREGNNYG